MITTANPMLVLGMKVTVARSFPERLLGLLGRPLMAQDEALLLAPCASIHTFWMRYAIDAVFLSRDGEVLVVVPNLRPWRAAAVRRAYACLELPTSGADRFGLRAGQRIAQFSASNLAGR